ncbi:hypothetical protein H072_7575 [Dactylellina haptotyla CBS 200.50]|uniref:RING-type domain-containing protein n=1 Tax=Dactylellina haptotyla (strain CBS 200.50) TaxID=1284197 RepID=S8A720_DACHA|nr:hypothetical protein H072_7575 [Dactylellina haptotyla CBS 200.50]
MDLPPAAPASQAAPLFLTPSTSTSAGHSSRNLGGPVGQAGPRSQPSIPRSSSSVLGNTPLSSQAPIPATEKCAHKDSTRCSIHQGECCSCADTRAHEQYYERLNSRIPPYRDNQPRITAWDLFHLGTPPNVPPPSVPTLTLSESARHSLTPSAQAAILSPEDGFPQSYAIFRLMNPNFSNEYHPVVAEHIRTWGELEGRIADEPRYSPEFQTLLAQYYNARYKAKRMTELDRQSRVGGLSVQATDEYFQLLSNPGPFDVPSTSTMMSSGSSSGGSGNGVSGGSGSNSEGSTSGPPNLGHLGTSFSRVATLGNFLQASSTQALGNTGNGHGNASSHQTPTAENRSSLAGISLSTNTITSPPPRTSPNRPSRRRGSTPFEDSVISRSNPPPGSGNRRSSTIIDRERERDRDRETGRITAGTSFNAAAAATASESLPSAQSAVSHSILPEPLSEIHQESLFSSHSRTHSLNRPVTSFLRSQRSRTLASVTSDIETDRTAADRRRQLRERNENEWDQRPLSASSSAHTNTNRTSVDSTVVDAIMSDIPSSSQNSEGTNGFGGNPNEPLRPGDAELPANTSLRRFIQTSPTSEPWNVSQFPGGQGRNQPNDAQAPVPSRRDSSSNTPTTNNSTGSSLGAIPGPSSPGDAPFIFPNRRILRPHSLDQNTANQATNMPPAESSQARNSLTSPTHRLPPNFLPSLPHLPAPRFSPPRTLTRPRGGSVSNNNNAPGHNRQTSTGSDGFPGSISSRRRERTTNTLAQALGTRADVERDDYESPIRTMFAQGYEEYRQAEEIRRRQRETEAEHREFLQNQEGSNPEANLRRLQEHRNRQYEFLQRANLQRQIDQLHAQNQINNGSSTARAAPLNSWYTSNWPTHHHHHSPPTNANTRSPDDSPGLPFGITPEDEHSSNSDDYEDFNPLDPQLGDDDSFFSTLVDGYLSRFPPNEAPSHLRTSRLRRHFTMSSEEHRPLAGQSPHSNLGAEEFQNFRPSRVERTRRIRERDELLRSRHNETIRDIANLVNGTRDGGVMGFPHRWGRHPGSESNGNNSRNNNNNPPSTRTLDHPERPDNMKEEDLKIMADCKVCYGQIADIVLLPCAHLVLCQWCADTVAPTAPGRPEGVVAPRSNCPVCRARVEKKIKVFRS